MRCQIPAANWRVYFKSRRFRPLPEMKALRTLFLLLITLSVMVTSGCMFGEREYAHPSWPKSVAATDLRQFEGVYLNHSLDSKTGVAGEHYHELFDFLTGQGHNNGGRGKRVEVRSTPDGTSLVVSLFDEGKIQVDSATLRCGPAFTLVHGELFLHGPSAGWRDQSGNFGPNVHYQRCKLHPATTGGLLGNEFETDFGLLCDIIPMTGATQRAMFWPAIRFVDP
jgi:hypothetical protein